jgi:hypothetical protein
LEVDFDLALFCSTGTSESDLDYFVRESGSILGVLESLDKDRDGNKFAFGRHEFTSKQILFHVLKNLVQFKKMDSDDSITAM